MMQTLQPFRPSPNLTALGGRYIDPRWRPNLQFCVDLAHAVPNPLAGAPGKTYIDAGPNAYVVQQTFGSDQIDGFDGAGYQVSTLSSSGGDLQISLLSSSVQPTASISMSVWYRADSFGNYNQALSRGPSSQSYAIGVTSGHLYFNVDKSGTGTVNFTPCDLVTGVWYHLAMTWDGSVIRGYVNGALVGTHACVGTPGTGNTGIWQINGGETDTGSSQPGASRYAMVWNDRVLTDQDIADLARSASPFQESQLGPSEFAIMPGLFVPDAPADGGPYVKVRHGGTGHGDAVRSVTSFFTFGYADFVVEADTTSNDISGFLPPWAARLGNREFVCVNTGANYVHIKAYDGGNINGASVYTIPPLTAASFVAGASEWKVVITPAFDDTTILSSLAAKALAATGLTATEGVQRAAGTDLSAAALLKLDVSGLTEDTTPDSAADFVATYDASASLHKKVKITNLTGGGGSSREFFTTTADVTASRGTAGSSTGSRVRTDGAATSLRPAANATGSITTASRPLP